LTSTPPLIFTPERIAKARAQGRLYSGTVLERLILQPDEWVAPQREQLERIAARISQAKRARVLGGLESEGVAGVVNQLLFTATLEENGWTVEHEPPVDGGTPDLRIEKDACSFIVEVVRVEVVKPEDQAIARIRDALAGRTTHRPICIRSVNVSGSASLKRFVDHVLALSDAPPETTHELFQEAGVLVAFDLLPRVEEPWPVYSGSVLGARFCGSTPEIRNAVAKKVKAYKLPLVVAVDLVGVVRAFHEARSAIYGSEAFRIPIDLNPDSPNAGISLAEGGWMVLPDGPLNLPGRVGERARARLLGVLPFQVNLDGAFRYIVNAALLGNPLLPDPAVLAPFAPIPRCVPTSIREGTATMTWLGASPTPLEENDWLRWAWIPAEVP